MMHDNENRGAAADVVAHYDRDGLEDRILAGLAAAGIDPAAVGADDLAPVDEFHVGGRAATLALVEQLALLGYVLTPSMHLLDVGCGIGGPARALAGRFGCRVTGVDLTPSFVGVAQRLTARVGLDDRVHVELADALALPFRDGTFDGAYLLHVGMNIADKTALFASLGRVVRPSGFVAVYDVLRTAPPPVDDGRPAEVTYPVPWASSPATSHPETLERYRFALEAAGFDVVATRDRREFALEFVARARTAATAAGGPPPLGLHLVLGADAGRKTGNLVAAMEAGVLAPTEVIAVRR